MILVTGATGFLGSHLMVHLLESQNNGGQIIRAIYRNRENISNTKSIFSLLKKDALFDKIQWVQADIIDIPSLEIAFKNVDYVYHCAALISFEPNDEEILRKTNIEGTANIVNFCLQYQIKKLCYVSSIAALGDLPEYEDIITETTDWNPEKNHSDYAISKYGAEMEIWRGEQEGLNAVIVNPGIILGVGSNDEGSGKIFRKVAKEMHFYTKGTSGFVSISDVAQIMRFLMESNITSKRYILVAENICFQDLTNMIAQNLKVKSPSIYAKKWMTEIAWRTDWFLSNLFFIKRKLPKAIAKSLHTTDIYSNEKIKKELEFEFQSIKDCIIEIAIYYR